MSSRSTEGLESEQKLLAQLALDYQSRGYTVYIEPKGDQIPAELLDFSPTLRPDMIALGPEGKKVLVEVKARVQNRSSVQTEYLSRLADFIRGIPGWSFELAIPPSPGPGVMDEAPPSTNRNEPFTWEQVEAHLEGVRQLVQIDQHNAALLLAWSATEAALRRFAQEEGRHANRSG